MVSRRTREHLKGLRVSHLRRKKQREPATEQPKQQDAAAEAYLKKQIALRLIGGMLSAWIHAMPKTAAMGLGTLPSDFKFIKPEKIN